MKSAILTNLCLLMAAGVFAKVTTTSPGWTFTDAETPVFSLTNRSAAVCWTLENWRGKPLETGTWPEDGRLTLPALPAGYYRVKGSEEGFDFCVVPSKRCRSAESFFAADAAISGCSRRESYDCPWYDGDCPRVTAELLGKCGLVHTRERWEWGNFISPKKDVRDFSRYLHTAKWMKANGVVSTGCFHDAPAWMNAGTDKKLPVDLLELYRFMEDAARTFEPYYDAWEFWNEPELGSTKEPVWEYVAALKAFALGARAGSKSTVILPGSLSFIEHFGYGQTLFEGEIAKYVQAFNLHTYEPPSGYDAWHKDIRTFLAEAGVPDWQVWLTESGTNLEGNGSRPSVSKGLMAHSPEQEMILAEFAPKSAILHQQGGIFRNWYFLFGCYNEQSGRRDWGTMRRDGTVKPIHASMATVASELGDAKLLGEKKFVKGVRAFVYVRPDGGRTLAYWRESGVDTSRGGTLRLSEEPTTEIEIVAPDGEYVNIDMMGTPGKISAADGKLKLAADRFPQYLRGAEKLDADIAAADPGKLANYRPAAEEDLSVVIRPETNVKDFDITGQKCIAELVKEKGRIRIEIWNLSGETKKGSLAVKGGTLEGIPEELVLAPWGSAALEAAYLPEPGDGTSFKLDISGVFNGRRTTRVRVPVLYTWRFMRDCKSVGLERLNRTDAWARNDSGQKFTCTRDEKEDAVCFDVEWDGSVGAWFFPVAKLAEGESFENAKYLEFEVKSRQDKVENDMHLVQVMCLYRHSGSKNVPFKAPTFEWEKRRIALPSDPGDIHSFRVGCLPRGKRLEFRVRNFRVLKAKK